MRTKETIIAEMDKAQEGFPSLVTLKNSGATGFYSLLRDLWVLLVQAVEGQVDSSIADANTALAAAKVGSLAWYVATMKAFQFGDTLSVYDNLTVGYPTVVVANQIIKQAACTETSDGRLLMKLAKADVGALGPLSAEELVAAKEYVRLFKFAGVPVDVISLAADELRIEVTVKYDRQILNSSGQALVSPASPRPVDVAVAAYIQTLPFDSVISWTALTDALQKVKGVTDFQITKSYTRPAGTSVWVEFNRETTSRAGHMKLSTESVFTYV